MVFICIDGLVDFVNGLGFNVCIGRGEELCIQR